MCAASSSVWHDTSVSALLAGSGLLALHEENEFLIFLRLRQQIVAGLLGERLKIAHRSGIRCGYPQYLTANHIGQRFLGLQYRQRTVQAPCIEFPVKFNYHTLNLKNLWLVFKEFYCKPASLGALQQALLYSAH